MATQFFYGETRAVLVWGPLTISHSSPSRRATVHIRNHGRQLFFLGNYKELTFQSGDFKKRGKK